jgi:hypothetical protein
MNTPSRPIKRVRTDWNEVVLVCRKCSKKMKGGGFGPDGDQRLAKALRREFGGGKGRKAQVGVIEVGCFDVCPKDAVVVTSGFAPDEWLVVPRHTPARAVAHRLGLIADPPLTAVE